MSGIPRSRPPGSRHCVRKWGRIFRACRAPRKFQFPLDHGPHPTFRHEWWYVTGNLDAENGDRFGFELTIFRFALASPNTPASGRDAARLTVPQSAAQSRGVQSIGSCWRTRQIYMAHFAVTDVGRERFRFSERFSRDALGMAGAQSDPFRVWLEDWSVQASELSLVGARPQPWILRAAADEYAIELSLQARDEPVLNGNQGLSQKSARARRGELLLFDATFRSSGRLEAWRAVSASQTVLRGSIANGAAEL